MKKVESLLPSAIEAIRHQKIQNDNNEVDNEYKGYIDTFAASIVHNGLLPAVVFNEQDSSESNNSNHKEGDGDEKTNETKSEDPHVRRKKLMRAILQVIKKEAVNEKDRLQDYVLDQMKNKRSMDDLRHEVGNAATAVKLGLRTFKFIKKDDKSEKR